MSGSTNKNITPSETLSPEEPIEYKLSEKLTIIRPNNIKKTNGVYINVH